MTVETLTKATGVIDEQPLREYINGVPRGVKGKLNELVDLCEGAVFQSGTYAVRIKGIEHTYEWEEAELSVNKAKKVKQ